MPASLQRILSSRLIIYEYFESLREQLFYRLFVGLQ